MQVAGVRVLSSRTGRDVPVPVALVRALFVLLPAAAALVLLNAAIPGVASSSGDPAPVPAAVLVLAASSSSWEYSIRPGCCSMASAGRYTTA